VPWGENPSPVAELRSAPPSPTGGEGTRVRFVIAANTTTTAAIHVDSRPLLIRLHPLTISPFRSRLWSPDKLDLVLPEALQREMLR